MIPNIIAAALTLGVSLGGRANGHPPAWMDNMIAGYALKYDETHGVIGVADPKTGFFIVRSVECDGGILTLALTRDRHYVSGEGFTVPSLGEDARNDGDKPLVVKPLPSLSTGKGIKIGDTPDAVRTKLGNPSQSERTGSRDQFVTWTYKWNSGKSNNDLTYEEVYTFKKGKLIEIIFSRLANDM